MASESLLVWKIAPPRLSSSRSSAALTRLPLWQRAIWPCWQSIRIGWALISLLAPAVEYRTWPTARLPWQP